MAGPGDGRHLNRLCIGGVEGGGVVLHRLQELLLETGAAARSILVA